MSLTRSSSVAVHSKPYPTDVFVVYDDADSWTRKEFLPTLKENSISYCSLEEDSNPGQSIMRNFELLLSFSRKVLFVISVEFCKSKLVVWMAEMASQTSKNIIIFFTDGELSCMSDMYLLRYAKSIHRSSENWVDTVVQEIRLQIPTFCKLLCTGSVLDLLFLRGLSLQDFRSEIFGLTIIVGNKYIRVDLKEFSKHLRDHDKYLTIETCKQSCSLHHLDSSVSIIINTDKTQDKYTHDLVETFGRLCQHVFDVSSLRNAFTPVCTVSGPFNPSEQTFVNKLFKEVYDVLSQEYTRNLIEPWVPKYMDRGKRVESFQGLWDENTCPSVETMATAGFYLLNRNCAQCFFCGFTSTTEWKRDDDPLLVHAQNVPTCRFLEQNLTKASLQTSAVVHDFETIEQFKSLSSREESFKTFDAEQYYRDEEDLGKKANISKLAECGFFYRGMDAELMCFACGLRILYTDYKSDPWFLHAELSSSCPHVRAIKGNLFPETVTQTKLRINEPTLVTFLVKKYDGHHRHEIGNLFRPCQTLSITDI